MAWIGIMYPDNSYLENHLECRYNIEVEVECIPALSLKPLLCTIVRTKRLNSNHIVTKSELPRGNLKVYGYSILIPISTALMYEYKERGD